MRVAYLLLTCEKYLPTRVAYQAATCMSTVPQEDIFYISSQPRPDRVFGHGVPDSVEYLTHKYIQFLCNVGPTLLSNADPFDWFFFGDDDTFIFVERLHAFLSSQFLNKQNEDHYIGCALTHVQAEYGIYASGGAGYLLSRSLFRKVVNHLLYDLQPFRHWCADLCMGLWIKAVNPDIVVEGSELFNMEKHSNLYDLNHAITFHHVHDRGDFEFYFSVYKRQERPEK